MVILSGLYNSEDWYANWLAYVTLGMMLLVPAYGIMIALILTAKVISGTLKSLMKWIPLRYCQERVQNEIIQELINI